MQMQTNTIKSLVAIPVAAALSALIAVPALASTRWHYFSAPGSELRMQVPSRVDRSHHKRSPEV